MELHFARTNGPADEAIDRLIDLVGGIHRPEIVREMILAALKAGFPVTVPAVQINRMCGSSQQAVHFAAQAVLAGDMDLVIAGGIEMMSHQAIGSDWPKEWPANFPYPLVHQGISAELMAEKWSLSREELDDYAYQSHLRAGAAVGEDRQKVQIAPVPVPDGNGGTWFSSKMV